MKNIATIFFTSLLSGIITLGSYKIFFENESSNIIEDNNVFINKNSKQNYAAPDLTEAARSTIDNVVHVKNLSFRSAPRNSILDYIYGYQENQQMQPQIGTGSGVIISEDGYIVTNNHVIQGASKLEITLNDNQSYPASLIGTDPKMDIALLKIDVSQKLPFATFANSDNIEVGEWVLAVGNPYNLTSTVTAGIISTKARNLSSNGIQSFIQTDAVVNPGNSGGALVNTRGELIGINTLISSETGSYIGYSFAVPSNLVQKIIKDIIEFGNVQKATLGVQGYELNGQIAENKQLKTSKGFYVEAVIKNSGANKANIQKGDVITKIDNKAINNFLELNSAIATKRPNDRVKVNVIRGNKEFETVVELTSNENQSISINGFEFENLTDQEKNLFGINEGIKIKNINNQKYKPYENQLKNGLILAINGNKVYNLADANRIFSESDQQNNITLDIITQKGEKIRITF